jgi:hypothetical protein
MHNCTAITSLAPLLLCSQLDCVQMDGCSAVVDVRPLCSLPKLTQVYIRECFAVTNEHVLHEKPGLEVHGIHQFQQQLQFY